MGDDDREAPAKSAEWLAELARKYGTTVLCSGEVDILTDGKQIYFVENGDSMMTALYRNRLYAECDCSSIFIRYRDCA